MAASFARDQMHRLETPSAEIYYPRAHRPAALAVAARLKECLQALRAYAEGSWARGKAVVFLTSADLNNAYVTGQSGGEPLHVVNPLFTTSESFVLFGLASGRRRAAEAGRPPPGGENQRLVAKVMELTR